MNSVTISKDKLLKELKANRAIHIAKYHEALIEWKKQVIEELQKTLDNAKNKIEYKTRIDLPEPIEYTSSYNEIIDQVEWNEEELIELDLFNFNQYIRDDWTWKQDFLSNTTQYMKKKII